MEAKIVDVDDLDAVRAAGGLVCRPGPAGLVEVAIIHRPEYDDWSLPKGKLEPGEGAEEAALREVEEETGLRCRLGESIGCTAYIDKRGRPKTVCYWAMVVQSGRFAPGQEVDQLRWLTVDEAVELLTYEHDRELLIQRLGPTPG